MSCTEGLAVARLSSAALEECRRLSIPCVCFEREKPRSQELCQYSLTRRQIEGPEASALDHGDSQAGRPIEFFANELNESAERERLHMILLASACVYEAV